LKDWEVIVLFACYQRKLRVAPLPSGGTIALQQITVVRVGWAGRP
jgi:hypothetical protein